MDPYHVFILHVAISGPQFSPQLEIWPTVNWQRHDWGITSTQDRELPDGTVLHRVTEARVPTVRVIATPTLTVLGKTNNLSWALPMDDTNTRVFAMIRKPQPLQERILTAIKGLVRSVVLHDQFGRAQHLGKRGILLQRRIGFELLLERADQFIGHVPALADRLGNGRVPVLQDLFKLRIDGNPAFL